MLKKILLILLAFCICSCGVSYPKETLIDDICKLVKKEAKQDCKVYKIDSTIYVDIQTEDILSNDEKVVEKITDSLQNASFAITRIALSSDADIKVMVLSVFDPNYQVALRVYTFIEDVKKYYYQRISRSDFASRNLVEFESTGNIEEIINNKHYISNEEYIARLIVYQINLAARANPFLSKIILALGLKYNSINDNKIDIVSNIPKVNGIEKILGQIIPQKLVEYKNKYKLTSLNFAVIKFSDGTKVELAAIDD